MDERVGRAGTSACVRPARASAAAARDPQRGRAARHRARAVHRRHRGAGTGVRGVRARDRRACRSRLRSTLRRQRAMPGVLAVITGRDLVADGYRRHPAGRVLQRPRRQADVPGAHAGARGRAACATSARRSRSWSPRRRTRRRTRPKPWRCASTPLPAASDVARAIAPDAPPLWAEAARQRRARLGGRRCRRGRGGIRARRACRARAADRHPAGAERDGAARRDRELRRASGALHPDRADPRRRGGAQGAGRGRVQGAARPHPHRHLRRGRRLRHEGAGLCRVRRPDDRGAPGRTPGQVVRQPHGELPDRHPRPRRAARGRARARCRRPLSRAARAHLGRDRRLHVDLRGDLRHRQHEELPVERVRRPGDPHRREDGAHDRGAARALSRRRPAGSDLPDRAPDRRGGERDAHRPCRAAAAQPDPGRRHAVPDAERADLRQRRFRARSWTARSRSPIGTALRRRRAGVGTGRQAARHRHRLLPRSRRRHSGRDRRPAVRARPQGGAAHRRAGDGAGPSVHLRAARRPPPRRRSRATCGWSRATATRCRRERRASRRARS